MVIEIEADGTETIFLPAGLYSMDIEGTLAAAFSAELKTGNADDGSDHVAATDKNGTAIKWTGSSGAGIPEPSVTHGGRYFSVVTTGYSGSSGVQVNFRKAVPSG